MSLDKKYKLLLLTHSYLITKEIKSMCVKCKANLSIKYIIIKNPEFTDARKALKNTSTLHEALNKKYYSNLYIPP